MATDRTTRLKEIGVRIRTRREDLGMTQEELGQRAELSKSRISEIEKGSSAANGLAYLGIAEALEVPVEWLLTGEGPAARKAGPPPISPMLSDLAEKEGWSHRLTVEVAAAMSAVHARRTAGGKTPEYTREQILKLAEALKEEPDA
jgi:transcriptional regulator with XRE-family HTH domain